jgi:hypothetical protein
VIQRLKIGRFGLIYIVFLSLLLSGCIALSDDITPPPGNIQPTASPATEIPSPTSTQTEAQPTQEIVITELGEGEVLIDVIDQTGGSLLEGGLEVILEGYDQFELFYQEAQLADVSGQVLFDQVPLETGRVFFASISYGGAVYRSDIVELSEEINSLYLPVQVNETTSDGSALFIERVHLLMEFIQPDLVNVVEIYILSNLGDATIVAESPGKPSVEFPLPAEAGSISFDDGSIGQRYLLTENGFGDTLSIPPGAGVYQVLVYYTLPYKRNKLDFKQEMAYPVGAAVVMTPAGNVSITKSNLEDLGVQYVTGGAVQVYSGQSIPRNQSLDFRISGKPETAAVQPEPRVTPSQTLLIVLGAIGGSLLLGGIVLFLRNRRSSDSIEDVQYPEGKREEILDSIIALEDLFENGEISAKAYKNKRKELKDQLSNLVDQ